LVCAGAGSDEGTDGVVEVEPIAAIITDDRVGVDFDAEVAMLSA
jgi:hypothetical protein